MITTEEIRELNNVMRGNLATTLYKADIGETIRSRDGSISGKITGVSERYCAACQVVHSCYLVKWEDGKRTKPCTKGVKTLSNGELQIN